MDGSAETHDIQRNKKGCFDITYNNIKLLVGNKIDVDCVCVVNKLNFNTQTINSYLQF